MKAVLIAAALLFLGTAAGHLLGFWLSVKYMGLL